METNLICGTCDYCTNFDCTREEREEHIFHCRIHRMTDRRNIRLQLSGCDQHSKLESFVKATNETP